MNEILDYELVLRWVEPNGRKMVERNFYESKAEMLEDADRRNLIITEHFPNCRVCEGQLITE